MKSLHLVKTSVGAKWAYRVMRDLVEMGDEVHVAMPTNGTLISLYKNSGVIVHELNYSMLHAFQSIQGIRKIVKEVQPDIIHSHFVITTLLMRLALRNVNIPRVFEVPGPLHLEHFIYRQADILTAQKKLDFWIPTCHWSYNAYSKCKISDKRLFLTYYGSDLSNKKYKKREVT